MELGEYFRILKDRWVTVAVIAVLTLAATAAATLLMTPQYTSSTRLYFAVQGGETISEFAQGSTFTEKQMASYAEVALSPLTLDPVIDELGLGTDADVLAESLSATVTADTTILAISATDTDPEQARDIANAVGDQLSATASDLSPERPDGGEAVRATVLSRAEAPSAPSSPNITRNLALGIVLGILLGVGVALLREMLDTRVRDEGDVAAVTDIAILTTVPDSDETGQPVFMHDEPLGSRSEAIRRLRTNLQFVDFSDRPSSILVTSAMSGEGKTTTSINLAAAMADAGSKVILVDADLRRPSVAERLGHEGQVGLTTVLIGKATLADVVQPYQTSSLDVLASGQVPPNPSELLGSQAMTRLLAELTTTYDAVIVDSSPLLPVTDPAVLSKLVGGTLVVASAEKARKPQLATALETLEKVNAQVLGVVLTRTARKAHNNYYGEYYASAEPAPASQESGRAAARSRRGEPAMYAPTHARRVK